MNSRFYSPELKQFLTIDDINYLDESLGNMNLFSYCNNNPVMYYAPWEAMADYLGGAASRYSGTIPQQQINNAWAYYILSLINPLYVVYYWF